MNATLSDYQSTNLQTIVHLLAEVPICLLDQTLLNDPQLQRLMADHLGCTITDVKLCIRDTEFLISVSDNLDNLREFEATTDLHEILTQEAEWASTEGIDDISLEYPSAKPAELPAILDNGELPF